MMSMRQHLVEAFPIGRAELFLDLRRHRPAVVIVDLQAEGASPAGHRLADTAHADDAETLAADAMSEHPGRRPARPVLAFGDETGALGQPPRHRENQRHGHIGGVLGQHLRGVGHGDAASVCGGDIDIVDAVAEIGDQPQLAVGLVEDRFGQLVRDRRHQDVGVADRIDELLRRQRLVLEIEAGIEQFAHARFDAVRQLAGDHNQRLLSDSHRLFPAFLSRINSRASPGVFAKSSARFRPH
jgi:hypothetical protein